MAMTKKEKQLFDDALENAKIAKALRWTDNNPDKDLLKPDYNSGFNSFTSGWDYNTNGYTPNVYQAWSESSSHGTGIKRDGYGNQNGIDLYSTKLLALKALRAEMELKFAKELLKIDEQIEKEMNNG
jgi:hypothetical protein